jgi:hypothetical protein
MNKAFTIPCITKDDVKSGRWAVKLEPVPSANAKRKMVQNLPAIVSYTDRMAAEDPAWWHVKQMVVSSSTTVKTLCLEIPRASTTSSVVACSFPTFPKDPA